MTLKQCTRDEYGLETAWWADTAVVRKTHTRGPYQIVRWVRTDRPRGVVAKAIYPPADSHERPQYFIQKD